MKEENKKTLKKRVPEDTLDFKLRAERHPQIPLP